MPENENEFIFSKDLKLSKTDPNLKVTPSGTSGVISGAFGNTDFGESQFDSPDLPASSIMSGEYKDIRGDIQSRTDKWFNAMPRLISKVGTEVAKTPAYMYALGEAAFTDKSLAQSLDNSWLNYLQNLDDKTKENFAIYKPKSVTEGNLWDNISSASFWTDEGVDGAGFLIAMMAPAGALRLANLSGKMTKFGVGINTAKNLELGAGTLLNSALESAAESKGLVDKIKPMLDEQWAERVANGMDPELAERLKNEMLNKAGYDSFIQNMVLITGPNFLMNKKLLGRFIPDKAAMSAIEDGAGRFVAPIKLTNKQIAKNYGKSLLGSSISEGFVEEGGQFAIENYNEKVAMGINDASLMDEYINGLSTTEGQKSVFLGAFLGSMSAVAEQYGKAAKDFKKEINLYSMMKRNESAYLTSINELYDVDENGKASLNPKRTGEYLAGVHRSITDAELKDDYARVGDEEGYAFLTNKDFTTFAASYLLNGGNVDGLNNHIDELSSKLLENEKKSNPEKNDLDEAKFKAELKQKAKQLEKAVKSIDNSVNVKVKSENKELLKKFANDLFNTALNETSNQMFIKDRINVLTLRHLELTNALSADIPQNKIEAEKIEKQIDLYNKDFEKSVKDYEKLFNKEEQELAFSKYEKQEKKVEKDIQKEEKKVANDNIKEFAERIKNGEDMSSEEDQSFYNQHSKEIDKELVAKTDEELTADLFGNPEQEPPEDIEIPSSDEINDSEPIVNQDKGFKAKTVAKTNQGFDGIIYRDSNTKDDHSLIGESQDTYTLRNFRTKNTIEIPKSELSQFERINKIQNQRVFRWVNKNEVQGYRLRIVTKNNNFDLYQEILQDNPDALLYEKNNPNYRGIWTIITDNKNEIVRVDGKLLAMTLETVPRIENDELIVDKKKGKEDIEAIREAAINTTNPNAYFEVTSKSNGIAQFERKENGRRVRRSIIGRIINKFSDAFKLTLATQKGTYINGIPLDLGTLYIEDKDGRVLDLLPRLINESEIDLIMSLLEQEITGNKQIDKPIDEIKKIISFKKTSDPRYQLYISNGELFFGEDSLNKANFEEKIEDLVNFLQSKRVNANSLYINKNIQLPTVDGSGRTISYAEYLLQGEDPMFGTDLKDKSNIQFLNQYLRYNSTIKFAEDVAEDYGMPTEDDLNNSEIIDSLGGSEIDNKKNQIESIGREINRLVGLRSNDKVVRQAIIDSNNKKITLEELDAIGRSWNNANGLTSAFIEILRLRKELEALENKDNIAIESLVNETPIKEKKSVKLKFANVGDILYDTKGNKYEVISKKDKYGRSLEYRLNDKKVGEINPKTVGPYEDSFADEYLFYSKIDALEESNTGQDAPIITQEKNPTPERGPKKEKKRKNEEKTPDGIDRLRSITSERSPIPKKELEWFQYNFPSIPIDKVIGLIQQKSMGRFLSSGKVLLSDKAVAGTLYHEAFHAVTQLYLTKEEVDRLYKEVADRTGITDRFEAEELLAEDFINYKKNGAVLKGAPQRNTLFRKILNAIKDFLGLKASDINEVYRRLDNGYYKNSKVVGLKEFSSLNKDGDKASITKEKGTKFLVDTLDGMDLMFFNAILHPDSANKNISNVIYNKFLDLYDAEENPELIDAYDFITDNFEKINSLWKERLTALGFKFSEDRFDYTEDYEEKGTDSLDEKEEQTKEDLKGTKDQNFVNQKDLLTSSSKMLIKSLKRLNYKNDLGLEVPLDYGQTYNYLIKNIAGTGNNFIDIMDKLKSLVKDKPEIQQLVDMLGETGDSISDKQFNLQTAFTKDFNKTRTDSLITVISPNGAIRIIDATKMNDADMVKEIWNNNLISLFPQNEAGNQIIPNVKEFIAVRDNIEFLSKLGIQFNEYTLAYLDENKSELTDSVAAIKNYLIDQKGNVNQLFSNKSDLYKRIDSLINLESKYAPYVNELSFFSTEGKTVYSVGENNGLSRTINEINKSKTLSELQKRLPHLDTVTVRNSQYIKSLFDENGVKKPGAEIKLYLQDGIKSSSDAENQVKQSTRKSSIGDLMVQQFNSLLQKGISSFIVSADKSSEFGIGLSLKEGNLVIPIEYVENNFNSPKIKEIFRGYFKDELNRIALFVLDGVGNNIDYYRKEADNFTIFQDIVPAETRKKIIEKLNEFKDQKKSYIDAKADIEKLLDNNFSVVNNRTVEFFENYEKEITNLAKKYNLLSGDKFYGVTDDLKAEFDINGNVLKKNNKHTNQALIRAIAINSYINNVEQTKLFTGDLAFYKAIYKRSAAHAGTKEMPRVDDAINSYLTKNFPRRDGKVQDGMENVVVFDNVETQKLELDEYLAEFEKKGIKPENALKILGFNNKKSAYAKMDEGDAMGWCTIDFYREFMKRLDNWPDAQENAYQKMQDGIPLTNKEIQLFQQLKLQYAGPQEIVGGLFAPAYHKFTVLPLLPELVKGKNISKTLENMVKNQIGYALFGSGSKVGSITNANGELTKFYTGKNNGEINSEGYNIQRVYYNYLGLQQKPSKPHDTAVFSTQFRKTPWIGSFQNGKELVKGAKKRFDTFSSLINEKIQATRDELLIELGIRPGDNTYTSTNVENLVKLLQEEAKERNLPSNMIESIDFKIEEGKQILKTKFDAVVNKDKITSMLMSLIDSRIIRQQFNGDAYVLSSVAGFEPLGERELGPNKALRGYTIDPVTGNTLPAEVMIPMSKNYYPLFKIYGNDLNKLNEAIRNKDPKIDPRVLELIGCRIPGQGQNSNEYLTVKEFLPEASATTMIAHPEIVAKAGSDFDNDKLFTYRAKINKDGTYDESDVNNKIVTVLKDQISAKENFTMLVTPNSTSIIDEFVNKLKYLKYKNKTILKNKTAEKPARIMDEEEYLKTLDQKGVKYSNLLKITEQIEARYKLWLAKDEVGPVAISNAYGPIAQAANLTANQFFFRTTVKNGIEVRERVSVNIRLKHNKVDDKINLASFFDAEEKNPITQVNEQLINIVVDAANETEPSVAYLNMLMETLPVYLYLNRAGVEFATVGSFMAQPIMSNYLMYKGISNSALSKVISIDGESNAIKKAKKPYINYLLKNVSELKGKEENIPAFLAENQKDQLDKSDLMEYLEVENQEGIEYAITQLQVLDDYSEYREQARMLNEAVRTTNHDSAGTGQSLISVEEKKILERKVASDGFINGLERVKETFLGPFNQDDLALKAYNPFFYTKEDPIIRNNTLYLLQEVKNNNYTFGKDDVVKTGNLIENDFINFIVQNYGYENPAQRMNELFAGENSIAKRVLALKNRARELNKTKSELSSKELEEKEIADNILITQLYPLLKTEKKSVDNIKLFNKKIDTYTSDQLTEAFEQLMSLDPELTKDIIDLGILQSGLNNSPITFLGIIPNSYYSEVVNKGFDKFSELSNKDEIVKQFNQLFLRNNVKDGFIGKVAYVKGVSKEPLGNGMFGKNFLMKNYMPSMSDNVENIVVNELSENAQPKGKQVANGIYVNQEGLNPEEELELFNIIKPVLEEQAVRSNKGKFAPKMAGLNLNWDYVSNRRGKQTRVDVKDSLKPNETYGWFSNSANGKKLYPITGRLIELMTKATGIDVSNYDGSIINIYNSNSFIGNHPDIDESKTAEKYPVVVVNIGGEGNIILGTNQSNVNVKLKSGAGYIFGYQGKNRTIPHSTYASPIKGTLPSITTQEDGETIAAGSYRISITMRRVMPLTPNMPEYPAVITTQPSTGVEQKDIYSKLGNKTKSENVVLPEDLGLKYDGSHKSNMWTVLSPSFKKQYPNGVVAYRGKVDSLAIGNPFSVTNKGENTVKQFIEWLTTGNNFGIETILMGGKNYKLSDLRNEYINIIKKSKGEKILYYRELGRPSHATALDYLINKYNWSKPAITTEEGTSNPADFTNHSGGATLSDAAWDQIGREFGVTKHNHYREPGQTTVDSLELQKAGVKATPLDETTYNEGQPKATVAARQMGRIEPNFQVRSNYIIRNWAQVKNANAIYAIGTIIPKGTLMSNNKTALIEQVKGGTGYAVQMAINEGKPVYVYDGTKDSWFKWNGKTFEKTITPTLTKNFAGIGSRTLSTQEVIDKSLQAIRDVYENTFKSKQSATTTEVKPGVEISSSAKGLAAALTNPTELAKSKGNLTQSYPVEFRDKTYKDAEAAYQALKDNSEAKTKPAIEDSNNYSLMVDIIKAKFEQHPRLVNEIKKQGGSDWILSATHQPTAQNSVWETGGQNWFIKALNEAYLSTGSNFKTKIDQFNYTYNPNTGEVIHNSKTGDKVETNETQINKVLVQYALENGYEIKAFNNSEYIKINNKVLNISNGNLVTQKQILDLFQNTEEVTNLDLETEKPLPKNEFTYKGKTIETEFKLGNDQEKALKELADFVTDSKETVITLQGAAGTGKTSVIGYLQKYIGKKFAYMAPTHAATAELAFATVKTGNTDLPSTIQSSLAYNAKEKTWKFSIKVQRRLGFRPTIVVDESSMIDDTDINKLKEAINDVGGKLILMGDEKQISKVIEGNNQTKQVSSAFTDYKQVNLNEIFRQKDADLLNLLSKMRNQTDFKLFKTENSENVKFLGKKEYMDELVSDLMLNPEGTVVVSYTNASVSSINTIAREILGRTGETKVGDIVVGYLGYASKQIEKADIANSVQYKIDSIIENGSVRQINVSSKKLENLINLGINNIKKDAFTNYYQLSNDDSLTFDNLSSEDFAKNNEEVSRVFRAIHKASLDYKNNRINYASYLSILAGINETLRKYSVGNDYIYNPETDSMEKYDKRKHASLPQNGQGSLKFDKDIDYGHAITIHKSQGSTIDNVYFDASSLSSARNTPIIDRNGVQITTEKQSLAYVAMSRSKNKLVVYEGAEEFEMINPKKTNNISKSEENNVPLTSEDDIILDTLGEDTRDSLITKMKEIFYSNKGFFNENGITDESQIEKLTETQLGELLIKFCK